MDKEIYAVDSKVRVTKAHSIAWEPDAKEGDVLTVKIRHARPHTWGADVDIYLTQNEEGKRVVVREDCIERYVRPFAVGDKVFVTETHSAKEGRYLAVYAGAHLTIAEFSTGYDNVPAHYWGRDENGDFRVLLPNKIALVESAPEKLTPPVAPSYVGKQGEVVWHSKDTDEEGYWIYNNYWGWSNFVSVKSDLWRMPEQGEDMGTNGVLATLDGAVQVV